MRGIVPKVCLYPSYIQVKSFATGHVETISCCSIRVPKISEEFACHTYSIPAPNFLEELLHHALDLGANNFGRARILDLGAENLAVGAKHFGRAHAPSIFDFGGENLVLGEREIGVQILKKRSFVCLLSRADHASTLSQIHFAAA